MWTPSISIAEDDVLAALRPALPSWKVRTPLTSTIVVLVLARTRQRQAGGDRPGVGVVGVGVEIVSRSTSCLPATKPVAGGQGSVMTVASRPFSRKQARPYQVISIGRREVYGKQHERRCPPNDTGSRRREGGGRNPWISISQP